MKPLAKCESFKIKNFPSLFDDTQCNLDDEFLSEGEKIQVAFSMKITNRSISISNSNSPVSDQLSNKNSRMNFVAGEDNLSNAQIQSETKKKYKKSQFCRQHQENLKQTIIREEQKIKDTSLTNNITCSKSITLKDEIKMLLKMLSDQNKSSKEIDIGCNQPQIELQAQSDEENFIFMEFQSSLDQYYDKKKLRTKLNITQTNYKDITMSNVLPSIDVDNLFNQNL